MTRWLAVLVAAGAVGGCGASEDPTPEKVDGTASYEFEQEDIDAAERARATK